MAMYSQSTVDGIAIQTITADDFSIEVYLHQKISAFYDAIIRSENQKVEDSIMFGDSSEEIPMAMIEIPINDSPKIYRSDILFIWIDE